MKYLNTLLVLLVLGLAFYLSHMYLANFVYPNTYIGDVDLTQKTRTEVNQYLKTKSMETVQLEVNTRIYSFSYEDLGILFYKERALQEVFNPNEHPLFRYINYISALNFETIVPPPLAFSQDFYTFLDRATFTFIDPATNEGKTYRIDPETLKTQLSLNFGKNHPIEVTLLEDKPEEKDPTIVARRVNHVTEKPVDVVVTDGDATSEMSFSQAEVKGVSTVRMNPETAQVDISVDKEGLQQIIAEYGNASDILSSDVAQEDLKNDFITVLQKRLDGQDSDIIVTSGETKANTSGDRAEKYIEVDLSQKTLYLFDGGRVSATIPVLSGVCSTVTPGDHSVKTKARSAYSPAKDTWIPYWVAFDLNSATNTLIGINEVPYKKEDDAGKPKVKSKSVQTESCISLPIGQAQQVYDFASVNMPVYVFE